MFSYHVLEEEMAEPRVSPPSQTKARINASQEYRKYRQQDRARSMSSPSFVSKKIVRPMRQARSHRIKQSPALVVEKELQMTLTLCVCAINISEMFGLNTDQDLPSLDVT